MNAKTLSDKRGEVTSSFFTISYIALSIPMIGVGLLAKWFGIQVVWIVFSVIIALTFHRFVENNKDGIYGLLVIENSAFMYFRKVK